MEFYHQKVDKKNEKMGAGEYFEKKAHLKQNMRVN